MLGVVPKVIEDCIVGVHSRCELGWTYHGNPREGLLTPQQPWPGTDHLHYRLLGDLGEELKGVVRYAGRHWGEGGDPGDAHASELGPGGGGVGFPRHLPRCAGKRLRAGSELVHDQGEGRDLGSELSEFAAVSSAQGFDLTMKLLQDDLCPLEGLRQRALGKIAGGALRAGPQLDSPAHEKFMAEGREVLAQEPLPPVYVDPASGKNPLQELSGAQRHDL
jgi:hypothetical protein